jgi:hypothetical protein
VRVGQNCNLGRVRDDVNSTEFNIDPKRDKETKIEKGENVLEGDVCPKLNFRPRTFPGFQTLRRDSFLKSENGVSILLSDWTCRSTDPDIAPTIRT